MRMYASRKDEREIAGRMDKKEGIFQWNLRMRRHRKLKKTVGRVSRRRSERG